jgi:hypothetical protein
MVFWVSMSIFWVLCSTMIFWIKFNEKITKFDEKIMKNKKFKTDLSRIYYCFLGLNVDFFAVVNVFLLRVIFETKIDKK